jgi:hypothetical protein
MQKTIINSSTKVRANSIVLDDDWTGAEGEWQIPDGHEIVNGEGNTGFVWDGTQFVDPDPITEEEQTEIYLAVLRLKRNALLTESDWTQYNDSPLTDEAKAEWAVHRQLLRDLPANTDDPADPTWPEAPE